MIENPQAMLKQWQFKTRLVFVVRFAKVKLVAQSRDPLREVYVLPSHYAFCNSAYKWSERSHSVTCKMVPFAWNECDAKYKIGMI